MARLRREALQTLYKAQLLEAKGSATLDDLQELLVKADIAIDLLVDIFEAIKTNGLNVNPTIGDNVIPIGASITTKKDT